MRHIQIYFLAVFLLFITITSSYAQYTTIHEIDTVMDMSPTYLPTYYTHINFIEYLPLKFKQIDTNMTITHLYDPLLKTENIYQNLGIVGQANLPIIFDYQREMGFLYQLLPYPLYFKKQSDLKFYKLQTTYSKIAYTFSFFKENQLFAEFTKYIKGVTVAANIYTTFNKGSFAHQTTLNICGDFLIHYELPSSIYGFRASYIINHLNNYENGGLMDVKSYQDKSERKKNAFYEVRTPEASSLITTHDFAIQNYVNIKDKKDRYFGTFTYDFQLTQTTIHYNDVLDTLNPRYKFHYYSNVATNDTTRIFSAKNAIQWSNFSPFQEVSTKNNFFHIAGGLLHDFANIEHTDAEYNSYYLFARTHIRLFKVMDITGQISYSFNGYTNNDAMAKAGISWAINRKNEHKIGINAHFYRNAPEYIMQRVATNNFQWDTLFQKQNIVQLKTFWNYKKYHVSVSYYYLNKLIYLSEELKPAQSENNGSLVQFATFIPFQYKNLGITANLNLQYCTKNVVNVPIFAGKLSVFYIIELLKKRLKILVGTDLMFNTAYHADAYLPVLHKFYYQKSKNIGDFIFMDANLTVKIDRIIFFLRIGNLLTSFMNYNNFTTPNYPVNDYLISLGITWRFHD